MIPAIILIVSLIIVIFLVKDFRRTKLLETVTNKRRGTKTERDLVIRMLKNEVPPQDIFHDLYLSKGNGKFSQIDVVVLTKAGILVFEVKDYSGWIYGNINSTHWVQVLAYGKRKYRFYNPVMQNLNHVSDLKRKFRNLENVPFYSIVVFYGNCSLKNISHTSEHSLVIYSNQLSRTLHNLLRNSEVFYPIEKDEIVKVLKDAVNNGSDKRVVIQHANNVKEISKNLNRKNGYNQ